MDITILEWTAVAVLVIWLIKNLTEDAVVLIKRRYNWKKDKLDTRDFKFTYTPSNLPPLVDLRSKCPPVVDQGNLGSCTANALAGALGFLEMLEQQVGDSADAEEFESAGFTAFSRLFIYWNERVLEGDTSQDNGAQIRDGVKSLATVGACSEALWTYDISLAFNQPSPTCFTQATNHKISSYQSLDGQDINALKTCLAQGFPFVFGFTVYSSFESTQVATTGIVPLPRRKDVPQGGHAVMCVGYDDDRQVFIVRNSWGTNWGDGGYFYMPYTYMTDPVLADDFWTLRK